MPDPIELRTDGPHSPDYTRALGDVFAEAVRVLNYATSGRDGGGLEAPSDVYTLLGALYTATERLQQLTAQLAGFLRQQGDSGRLADDHGRNPAHCVALAIRRLSAASGDAKRLTGELQAAQNEIAGLYVDGPDE